MGASASRTRLTEFYLPVFLIAAVVVWIGATQKPDVLDGSAAPDFIKTSYRHKPMQFAASAAVLITLLVICYNGDVQWGDLVQMGGSEGTMGEGGLFGRTGATDTSATQYFSGLMPAESYGLDNTTGANYSKTGRVQFENQWASGPG